MKKVTIVLLFIFSFFFIQAQDTLTTKTLEGVEVREKKFNPLEKSPSGDNLERKDLQVLNTASVGDAVKFLSGVSVKDYGGLGGVKTISVRGLSSNHTAILYDGVNIFDNQSGQVDLGKYSLSSVSSLSVSNGQFTPSLPTATSLASASAISILTEKPNLGGKTDRGELSLSLASFHTANADVFYARRLSNMHILTAFFDFTSSEGDYPYVLHYGNKEEQKTQELIRENNDLKTTHGELNWFWDIDRTNTLKVKAYFYYSDRGLPDAVTLYYMNSLSRLKNKNAFMQSTYTSYLNGLFTYKNNFKFDWNFTEYNEPLLSNGLGGEDDVYKQSLIYMNNALSFQPQENLFFTLSNDLYYNSLVAQPQMDGEPQRFSSLTALVADYRIGKRFFVTADVLHSFYNDLYMNADKQTHHFSPFISFKYENKGYAASLFYKNIFRMPTFNELYYRRMGDKNLKPEETSQISLTTSYSRRTEMLDLFTELSLYHNDVKDKIVALPKNIYLWSMLNYGSVEIYGFDVRLGLSAVLGKFVFDAKLNYSYQHAADNEETSLTYKQILPYSPEQIYTIIGSLSYKNIKFAYNCMLVDNRYSLPENIPFNVLPHYADHSANLTYVVKTSLGEYKLVLSVNNILNRQYEVVRSYPMMGRNFSLKINFNS